MLLKFILKRLEKVVTQAIAKDTYMDMMYMDDAIDAIIKLMEADSDKLVTRNGYNLSAMSFEPEQIKAEIQNIILTSHWIEVDPVRQAIADSWPDNIDTSYSRKEWGFNPKYDLAGMTELMLKAIEEKEQNK